MLSTTSLPLPPQEHSKLLAWLSSPEAQTFYRIIEGRIASLEAEVGVAMGETGTWPERQADAKEAIDKIIQLKGCLLVMKEAKESAGDLKLCSVDVGYVFTSNFATNDAIPGSTPARSTHGAVAGKRPKGRTQD